MRKLTRGKTLNLCKDQCAGREIEGVADIAVKTSDGWLNPNHDELWDGASTQDDLCARNARRNRHRANQTAPEKAIEEGAGGEFLSQG